MINGFVIYEGQKFCSRKCKQEYIDSLSQMKPKEHNDVEVQAEQKQTQSNNEEESSDYEGDHYDPMEDF